MLHRWGIEENPLCTFCKQHQEKLTHLFWNCEHTTRLWNKVNETYCKVLEVPNITMEQAFLGLENKLLCSIVFAVKQYIYQCKYANEKPIFQNFQRKLHFIQQLEFNIAKNSNKTEQWLAKWEPLV